MNANEPPKDHVDEPGHYEDDFDFAASSRANGQRLVFMVVMAMLFGLGVAVGSLVVVLQFFWVLFTGETKRELSLVGRQLGEYGKEIVLYMTFNTDQRPFPFDRDWPAGSEREGQALDA